MNIKSKYNDFSMIDEVAIVLYAITYHYIGGHTLFHKNEQIYPEFSSYVLGGEYILPSNINNFNFIQSIDNNIEIFDIANALEKVIEKFLNITNTNKISLSLTGGFDSRILLSILKKMDVELHCYTYGNPSSIDCIIAKEIAETLRIPHCIYDVKFNAESFYNAAEESIKLGEGLCSLHRAHRIEAIKKESEFSETMFLGTMGGEFIKGANHDDYIISNFVFEYANHPDIETIKKYMKIRGLVPYDKLAEKVKEVMDEQSYIKNKDNMELYALIDIAAKLHHGQNFIHYRHFFPNIFTPYCDIDYLNILFSSKYNFLYRRKNQSSAKFKLENPRFGSLMQYYLNKSLANIPYSNGFSAKEYLISPYYAFLKAKYRKFRKKTLPNFSLGKWMEEFVVNNLNSIIESESILNKYFDIHLLLKELDQPNLPKDEPFWLKYTCPVQIFLTQKIFGYKE